MHNSNPQSNNSEIADLHGYNRISTDYSSFTITNDQFQDSPLPDVPPPSYAASVDNSSTFNNNSSRVGGSHIVGLVDPMQPNRTVPKNTIHGSLPTIAHPQKKKADKPMDEDYLAKKLEKCEQTYGRSNKHNNGKNCCDSFWWVLVSAIIFAIGAYKKFTYKEDLASHNSTTFLFIGGGIQLFMTMITMCIKCSLGKQEKECFLCWTFTSLLFRLGICTWGSYVLFLKAKASSVDTKPPTPTPDPLPVDPTTPTSTDDGDGGSEIQTWVLVTIVAIYWTFLFLFCCCRVIQGNNRHYHDLDANCCLCSVECLECCTQCTEDCGKGQITNIDGPGTEDLCGTDDGCNCCNDDCDCDCDCGNCDCGSCDC